MCKTISPTINDIVEVKSLLTFRFPTRLERAIKRVKVIDLLMSIP